MTAVMPDIEEKTHIEQEIPCEVIWGPADNPIRVCGDVADFDLIMACQDEDHVYSISVCTAHKDDAIDGNLYCRGCAYAISDGTLDRESFMPAKVVTIWPRH